MKRTFAAAVALPWLAFASAALANRPLNTDTADVIEPGTNQLEVYASHVTASGVPDENGWTAQLSHGFGHRTQLSAAVSRARAGDASATGALLGGKSWLIELGEADPGLSFGYGITGVKAAGDSWRHESPGCLTLVRP